MERLLKYCLSILFAIMLVSVMSCSDKAVIYKKDYTKAEKEALSESLLNAAGTDVYYQGTIGERQVILEGNSFNPKNAWGQRELGVPYLKRGFAHEANKYYKGAIKADPQEWLGNKAYCWLYFYRDYETALKELITYDSFTPDFVDYPQATSVDYMKGVCYLKLDQQTEAISCLTKHLKNEIENVGHEYIDAMPYQLLGIAFHDSGEFVKADSLFQLGLIHNANTADLYYYRSITLDKLNRKQEAIESLEKAEYWLLKGGYNQRPYVEEFYSIYKEDIKKLKDIFGMYDLLG